MTTRLSPISSFHFTLNINWVSDINLSNCSTLKCKTFYRNNFRKVPNFAEIGAHHFCILPNWNYQYFGDNFSGKTKNHKKLTVKRFVMLYFIGFHKKNNMNWSVTCSIKDQMEPEWQKCKIQTNWCTATVTPATVDNVGRMLVNICHRTAMVYSYTVNWQCCLTFYDK